MPTALQTITAALDAAFAMIPGVETVTVTQIDPDTGEATATASGVLGLLRSDSAGEESAGEAGMHAERGKWRLRASDVVGFVPKSRDRVTQADGTVWVLAAVGVECRRTRYVSEGCCRVHG